MPAFTPSHTASPPFGWYSFPILLKVGDWVWLGGFIKILGWYATSENQSSQYQLGIT